jgi:transcriptional regulator with XRE-family HTH domain
MSELTHTLPATLAQARKARRLSQLELALRLQVSQRHVSFVESGRAKPSRDLLLAWLLELDTPLVVRNAALLQAGFAPVFSQAPLGDPLLAPAHDALLALLQTHEPMPALVLDAHWNVLHMNRGAQWLAGELMPDLMTALTQPTAPSAAAPPLNMLDVLCHQQGLSSKMCNLAEVGPALLAHLRDDASVLPALRPKVEAYAALLKAHLGSQLLHNGWSRQTTPVLTARFASQHGELAFFSMFTTFGTPQDITLASLRVEHMFAADAHTRAVLMNAVTAKI